MLCGYDFWLIVGKRRFLCYGSVYEKGVAGIIVGRVGDYDADPLSRNAGVGGGSLSLSVPVQKQKRC